MQKGRTIHLGGTLDEIAMAERDVARGKIPARPFCAGCAQSLFDTTRAPAGKHTLWAMRTCRLDATATCRSGSKRKSNDPHLVFVIVFWPRHTMNAGDLEKIEP